MTVPPGYTGAERNSSKELDEVPNKSGERAVEHKRYCVRPVTDMRAYVDTVDLVAWADGTAKLDCLVVPHWPM